MSESKCVMGTKQSPINIISANAKKCSVLCNLRFFYRSSLCTIENNGFSFTIRYDTGSSVIYKDEVFSLETITVTIPSSHKIDGKSYDAEIMINHKNTVNKNLLILSIFLQLDNNDIASASKGFLDEFIGYLPGETSAKQINLGTQWNVFDLLPEDKGFYTYQGSTIREPCSENVTWIVMNNPVYASLKFFDEMKKKFPKESNRGARNDDTREVLYNPNNEPSAKQNYGSSMRCYDELGFRSQCSLLSRNALVEQQKDESMKYIIILLLAIVVIVLFILLVEKAKVVDRIKNVGNRLTQSFNSMGIRTNT
jgi:carbonic anhydrase